jgi:hypothetical protein
MQTSELLAAAKKVIEDPSHWTKGLLAEDSEGRSVKPISSYAVCWCSVGAIERVSLANNLTHKQAYEACDALRECIPGYFSNRIPSFNDAATHSQVMDVFDKAIIASKEAESKKAESKEAEMYKADTKYAAKIYGKECPVKQLESGRFMVTCNDQNWDAMTISMLAQRIGYNDLTSSIYIISNK